MVIKIPKGVPGQPVPLAVRVATKFEVTMRGWLAKSNLIHEIGPK